MRRRIYKCGFCGRMENISVEDVYPRGWELFARDRREHYNPDKGEYGWVFLNLCSEECVRLASKVILAHSIEIGYD